MDKKLEDLLIGKIVEGEYNIGKQNNIDVADEFEGYVDMLDCIRDEKNYEWLSNVTTGEFTSLHLSDQANVAAQLFSQRDFVDVYLGNANYRLNAIAQKNLINNTLNQMHLHYFLKIMRINSMKSLDVAYAVCRWEQETTKGIIGTEMKMVNSQDKDINGEPLISDDQVPGVDFIEIPVEGDIPIKDRFNFDVVDRRNVFTASGYTYSIQDERWVILKSEDKTFIDMQANAEYMGYINLDKLKPLVISMHEENTSSETPSELKSITLIERYGKYPVKQNGKNLIPAFANDGTVLPEAEFKLMVIAFAIVDNQSVLIRFQEVKYKGVFGNPYIPIIRWINYVHPTKKEGIGDAPLMKQLQIALDDTINISNDRTLLSTMLNFVVNRRSYTDNDSLFLAPGHNIIVEDIKDIKEMKISSDIGGAINQSLFFKNQMQQLYAVNPSASPTSPIATATDIVSSQRTTTARERYKAITSEETGFTELYWMITQMTHQFAFESTIVKLVGENHIDNYNPELNYTYKAISNAIETEYSKNAKIKTYLNFAQIIASIQNPKVPALLNEIFKRISELSGKEYESLSDILLDETVPGGGEKGNVKAVGEIAPPSNQMGLPQSEAEQFARQT